MGLEANTIDLDALGFYAFDDILGSCSFGAWALNVVVVIIEFGTWICCGSGSKCNGDVLWADDIVENVGPVRSVIIKC